MSLLAIFKKEETPKKEIFPVIKYAIKPLPSLVSPFFPKHNEKDVFWPSLKNEAELTTLEKAPYVEMIEEMATKVLSKNAAPAPKTPTIQDDSYADILAKVRGKEINKRNNYGKH